jgi:hypothetical protein
MKTIAQASAWVKLSIGNRPETEEPIALAIFAPFSPVPETTGK